VNLVAANHSLRDLALLGLVGALLLVPLLGQTVRLDSREVRHAEVARELAASGDWAVGKLLGQIYPDKPPIYHAPVALAYELTGNASLGNARAVSVLAAILGAFVFYGLARVLASPRLALPAALALLVAPGWAQNARVARPDMVFALLVLTGCWLLALALRPEARHRALLLLGAGAATGLACLTKGPLGLVAPILLAIVAPVGTGLRRPHAREIGLLGMGVALGVAVWLVPAWLRDADYVWAVISQRDLPWQHDSEGDRQLGYYFLPALGYLMPLALFLPLVARDLWRGRSNAAGWVALGLLLVLTMAAKKRTHYLVPMCPFALLAIVQSVSAARSRWMRNSAVALCALAALVLPYSFVQQALGAPGVSDRRLAMLAEIDRRVPPAAPIVCFDDLGEWMAFFHRRSNVHEAADPDALAASLAALGPGAFALLPDQHRGEVEMRLAPRRVLRERIEGPALSAWSSGRWRLYELVPLARPGADSPGQ
jgi:4-amino-4-deoxy-L-arabinose transferase-like glycosyltransferase